MWRLFPTLLLAACAGHDPASVSATRASCAPFARALTGVDLHGPAASWWGQADGRYARVHVPETGSILVFARSDRLPSGHVSVVSRIDGPRAIAVMQANWVPGTLGRDQPVADISERGDWSLVRVWWPPVEAMGSHAYPTTGFIIPKSPLGHDALAAGIPAAAARAGGG